MNFGKVRLPRTRKIDDSKVVDDGPSDGDGTDIGVPLTPCHSIHWVGSVCRMFVVPVQNKCISQRSQVWEEQRCEYLPHPCAHASRDA